jgi:hypothetical protein
VAGSLRQGPGRTSISLCLASRHLLLRAHAGRTSRWCFASLTPALRIRVARARQTSHGKSVESALAGSVAARRWRSRCDMVEDETGSPASSSTPPCNNPGSRYGACSNTVAWRCSVTRPPLPVQRPWLAVRGLFEHRRLGSVRWLARLFPCNDPGSRCGACSNTVAWRCSEHRRLGRVRSASPGLYPLLGCESLC